MGFTSAFQGWPIKLDSCFSNAGAYKDVKAQVNNFCAFSITKYNCKNVFNFNIII